MFVAGSIALILSCSFVVASKTIWKERAMFGNTDHWLLLILCQTESRRCLVCRLETRSWAFWQNFTGVTITCFNLYQYGLD